MPEVTFDWYQVVDNLVHLAIAYVLAIPTAWDRERESRGAGLRTFPLVAMAACGYMLVGISVLDSTDAEARIFYGIITGMGFIGGGAILKAEGRVSGTATAAALWNTGALGTSVAWQRYEIALLLSIISFVTLRFVKRLKTEDG